MSKVLDRILADIDDFVDPDSSSIKADFNYADKYTATPIGSGITGKLATRMSRFVVRLNKKPQDQALHAIAQTDRDLLSEIRLLRQEVNGLKNIIERIENNNG